MNPQGIFLVSSYAHHPRLRFVAETVFELWHGLPVKFSAPGTMDNPELMVRIEYEPACTDWLDLPPGTPIDLQKLDPPGRIFYGLSLWERYYSHLSADSHGRICEDQLPSVSAGWHLSPYVHTAIDEWCPGLLTRPDSFRFERTVDVDQVFRFRSKPPAVSLGALARDLLRFRFAEVLERIQVWNGSPDPYDTAWDQILRQPAPPIKVFFLQGTHPKLDSRFKFHQAAYKNLINKLIDSGAVTGIHPSYYSSETPELIRSEIEALQAITRSPVHLSRQHYLKFRLPDTFRELENAGIREEYSLSYYSIPGFACGTTMAFPWYDIGQERKSDMMIFPSVLMDRTICQYLSGNPSEKAGIARRIRETCRVFGIPFRVILHHEAFAGRDEWSGLGEMLNVMTGATE